MVEGTEVVIGGKTLTIPRLNLKAQRKLGDNLVKVTEVSGVPTAEQLEAIAEVVTVAIQRNYPEIGRDWIEENVEFDDLASIVQAAMKSKRNGSPNAGTP